MFFYLIDRDELPHYVKKCLKKLGSAWLKITTCPSYECHMLIVCTVIDFVYEIMKRFAQFYQKVARKLFASSSLVNRALNPISIGLLSASWYWYNRQK